MRLIDADALMAHEFKNDISYKAFCNLVKRQPTVDTPRWIPCDERMPDEDTDVLVIDEDGDFGVARYTYNSWTEEPIIEWRCGEYRVYPIAWQPLTEPYKEGE